MAHFPLLLASLLVAMNAAAEARRLEAEDAALTGVEVAAARPGFSGAGYVTGFDGDGDRIEWDVRTEAGLYEIRIGYATPSGEKGFGIEVNDEKRTGMFPGKSEVFQERAAGKFFFRKGGNRVAITKGWGWYEIDYIELHPATIAAPRMPPKRLADPKADAAAVKLMDFLVDNYGRKILSGQYEFAEIAHIRERCGKSPAVGGFDLMEYSPSRIARGADPKELSERVIAWAKREGGIVTLSWHWNAPADLIDEKGKEWWRGFYTHSTAFDIEKTLADESSEKFRLIVRDLDAAAAELKKFRDARVPVLWRPLHEAQGAWFWWGAKGPGPCVALWRMMFHRFVRHHELHNLIWVYSPPAGGIEAADWYPGDEYVDAVAPDIYTDRSSSMSGEWEATERLYGGRKLIALGESGFPPDPEKMRRYRVWWSWFAVWGGKFIRETPDGVLRSVFSDPDVITLDEL